MNRLQKSGYMEDDTFKIYVDQLRDGKEHQIHEKLSPDFLDVHERDLKFEKDVKLDGVAYLAESELILNWTIDAEAVIPCSICNEPVPVKIHLEHAYFSEPLDNIKSGIFNFKELLREMILLEVPPFVECTQGNCPKRKEFKKYLKEPSQDKPDQEDGYQPFADLKWE